MIRDNLFVAGFNMSSLNCPEIKLKTCESFQIYYYEGLFDKVVNDFSDDLLNRVNSVSKQKKIVSFEMVIGSRPILVI